MSRALDALPLLPTGIRRALDLGSGGGLPGLPLALALPSTSWVLIDGSVTRCRFLRQAVDDLLLAERVEVVTARAEEGGRRPDLRAGFDLVVARSFGPPAVTAECAAPFLVAGGTLVVAEPPEGSEGRWPAAGLALLGMVPALTSRQQSAFQVIRQDTLCPERYPRRTGIPAKRPLF